MSRRSRMVCLSAAVAAAMCVQKLQAVPRDLKWDSDGELGVQGQDGGGNWDLTSSNWVDSTPANVVWDNSGDNAIFGDAVSNISTPVTNNIVDLQAGIIANNVSVGVGANQKAYIITDSGGSLTVNGNIIKHGSFGTNQFLFFSGPINLPAGDHKFSINDSPNDLPELAMNAELTGAGNVVIDNDIYTAFGTTVFNIDNSYTGTTTVSKGRLVMTTAGALGNSSADTTISNQGTLSIGGAGTIVSAMSVSEPITITRDTYTGGEFARYNAAFVVANQGTGGTPQTHTITGPLKINSTDARIQVNTNTLNIQTNLSTDIPNAIATLDGDFSGFINLQGDNTAFVVAGGGFKLIGGVEVSATTDANLGGASSPITFAGSATLHPVGGFMTTFGTHVINQTTFSGGLDIDENQTFTVDIPLGDSVNAVGSIGKRGKGTLNLNSVINLRGGQTFWDRGTVNVNNAVTLQSLHLRSPIVNIGTGGSVTMATNNYSSFGQDTFGTDNGPDIATVNITGTGALIMASPANNIDFNVSDNANTSATINLHDQGTLSVSGLMHVGKSAGGTGTINQDGGSFTLTRNGDFTLVLGSRAGTGTYNLSGGTMTSAGEFYVGQGGAGQGIFNMSGGSINTSNWFVVAREGGTSKGTVDISGGTFTQTGGNFSIGESNQDNTFKLRNNAKISTTGEFYIGNNGGNRASMTMSDTAQLTINSWFDIGRFGAQGTLTFTGGTITKGANGGTNTEWGLNGGGVAVVTMSGTGANAAKFISQTGEVRIGTGSGGVATVTLSGDSSISSVGTFIVGQGSTSSSATVTLKNNSSVTVSSGEFWVGNTGGTGVLNIQDNASITVQNNWFAVGRASGSSVGTVNMSGGTLTKQGGGFIAIGSGGQGTFFQTGGTIVSSGSRIGEASSGRMDITNATATFNGEVSLGFNNNVVGTLNINTGANVTMADAVFGVNASNLTSGGVMKLNGGTVTAHSIRGGANATGLRTLTYNGGTLKPSADDTSNWIGAKITGIVSTGGGKFDSNGKNVNVNSDMTHDTSIVGLDGGVNKTGAGSVTFSGSNSWTGPTTVQQGTMALGKSWTPANSITLSPNTTLALAPIGTQQVVLSVTPSTIVYDSTDKIDLVDNKMVFKSTNYSTVKPLIDTGRNGGNWDGPGYITSRTAAKLASQVTTLAIADNALAAKTTFGGQSVSPTDILVMYTYNGDADLNGKVNADDYFTIDSNYNKGPTAAGFIKGDFNADGQINGDDYALIDMGYAGQGAPLGAGDLPGGGSLPGGVSAVPEPASLGIMGLAAVGLMRRRRARPC